MDAKMKETILNPLFKGNPISVLVLGICSSLAVTVELIDRHKVLVRGYLKNAVSRGVDYQLTGSKVLASVIAYNVSPRIRQIA